MGFFDIVFLGNTMQRWLIAVAVALSAFIVLRLMQSLAVRRLGKLIRMTATPWDDLILYVLDGTKSLFLFAIAIKLGSHLLTLSDTLRHWIDLLSILVLLVQGGIWMSAAVAFWLKEYKKEQHAGDPTRAATMAAIGFVCRLVAWSIVVLLALDNVGIDVTALVAGLGIGGIAIALAVQNVLGDLFASLSILFDKPFVLGDFLVIDEHLGSVEKIGLKSTRLRSLSGEQIIFSNADLLKSRIKNYGRMEERRVAFTVGVTYQTSRDKLEKIPEILREAVEAQQQTRFDRSHFKEYGAFSINFETVYYVLTPDYNLHMDIQQAVNLRIHERFEAEAIEFAQPTQAAFAARRGEVGT